MEQLTRELEALLRQAGAALVGVGDLTELASAPLPRGVAVALPLPVELLRDIQEGPTKFYYDCYHSLNGQLNEIVSLGAAFLESRGHQALAQTTERVTRSEDERSPLPHKTVALRAGLGWIGKSCLLVTPEYGGAVRISSLLTDAPLDCVPRPLPKGRCESCQACVAACPGGALRGESWEPGRDRDELLDYRRCRETAGALMLQRAGLRADICGQCFVACPFTRAYLRRASSSSN